MFATCICEYQENCIDRWFDLLYTGYILSRNDTVNIHRGIDNMIAERIDYMMTDEDIAEARMVAYAEAHGNTAVICDRGGIDVSSAWTRRREDGSFEHGVDVEHADTFAELRAILGY